MKRLALALSILFLTGGATAFLGFDQGKAAIIQLDGPIQPSTSNSLTGGDSITPEKVRSLNSRAINQGADAVIYEWNSGGGAVVASKEIMRSIESMSVPTVCRFRDVAASGAYLSSLGCDKIVADSATITGSIGVKSSYLEFSGLLERYGVEYVNISSGKYKEIGSRYQNTSEAEIAILQEKADKIHEEFIGLVIDKRKLNSSNVEELETGEIMLGSEAKESGMVDELGGREVAIIAAENMTGREMETFKVEQSQGLGLFSLLTADISITPFAESGSPLKAEWN